VVELVSEEDEEAVNLVIEARILGLRFEDGGRWIPPPSLAGRLDPAELVADLDYAYADALIWSARDGTEYLLRLGDGDAARGRLARADHARRGCSRGSWSPRPI